MGAPKPRGDTQPLVGIVEGTHASVIEDMRIASADAARSGDQVLHANIEGVLIHLHWLKERAHLVSHPSLDRLSELL